MSDITTQLNNFRSIFNKLMKSWRNYPDLFDLVKKHYTEVFKHTLSNSPSGSENDGLIIYITNYIGRVKPHLKYIKQHDEGIFTNDYMKESFEIFEHIDMKYIWYKLSKEDRKSTWSYIEKLYVIGIYITSEKDDLEKQKKVMYELYYNINQDKIVSDASKYLIDNKLSVTQDIDTSDLTDEDFLEENCVSFEDKIEEVVDKLSEMLSSMENGEQLGHLIIKIVKKIKFPKKLLEKIEHITENPLSILKLITDKRVVSHITGYMEKVKNSLTPEDLDVMKSLQNNENIFETFQHGLGKLFDGIFTPDEIKVMFDQKNGVGSEEDRSTDSVMGLTVEQMELLKSKMSDEKIKEVFEKTYQSFERLKIDEHTKKEQNQKTISDKNDMRRQPPITGDVENSKNEKKEEMNVSSLLAKMKEIDNSCNK